MEALKVEKRKPFSAAFEDLEELAADLQCGARLKMNHSELEHFIDERQREISRKVLEDAIRIRGSGDVGLSLVGSDDVERTHKRMRETGLRSIFGDIAISRVGYGLRGEESLFPLDGQLNLPEDSYSHGIRTMLGQEVAKNSFDEAIAAIRSRTGVSIPKRQAEELSRKAAADFELFYDRRLLDKVVVAESAECPILALTTDGKGVVMIQDDLREATRKKAVSAEPKLKTRLSRGEKPNAKRMAQVASVYSIERHHRTPEEVCGMEDSNNTPPRPVGKRVWARLDKEQPEVISDLFDEAQRRDPEREKEWVALIDGQASQLERIKAEAKARKIKITIIADLVHVIEYLWKAAWQLFDEGSKAAEAWVTDHLLAILKGDAKRVAAGIRRSATFRALKKSERRAIDKCADYLHKLAPYLAYDRYLQKGYPIATGVIEGACRYLVKDRMEITGARWSLSGAESILRLRSLHASGDLEEYWQFHKDQEFERNHESKYRAPAILRRRGLRVVQ
jgi:hypothetical protein